MKFWFTIGLLALGSSALTRTEAAPGSCKIAVAAIMESTALAEDTNVLGVIGFSGNPQPEQWLILTQSRSKGALREFAVAEGRVVAERMIEPLPGQDIPDIPIKFEEVRIDSDEALQIALGLANEQGVKFEAAHFHLRCRDTGSEPVWLLKLLGPVQDSRGLVYLSARTGEVLRTAWTVRAIDEFAFASPILSRR